jgi:hypothetical protein
MTFTDLRKIDLAPVRFTPEGMAAFRDAALAKGSGEAPARIELVVAALAPGKS